MVPACGFLDSRSLLFTKNHTTPIRGVSTEGGKRGLAGLLAEKVRAISMDSTQEMQIPRDRWGVWPKGVKQPVPFRKEAAKCFLDSDSLQDGQNWLAGFVQGVVASMVIVPLLSWTEVNPDPLNLNPEP